MRADAAPKTRKCRIIFRSRVQGCGQSTTVDSPRIRREHGLAVSLNSPQSRPVPGNRRVNGESVNRQGQRTRPIRRQVTDMICPRPQSGRIHNLSVTYDWPMNVRTVATHFRAVVNTLPDHIQRIAESCPRLIPVKSARQSRNLLRAGQRNSTN
jgi:hypothetical protein